MKREILDKFPEKLLELQMKKKELQTKEMKRKKKKN